MELFKMSAKTKQKKRYFMDRSTLFAAALTSRSDPQTSSRSHVFWVERCSAGQLGPFGRMKDRRSGTSRRCGGNGGRGLAITGRDGSFRRRRAPVPRGRPFTCINLIGSLRHVGYFLLIG